MLMLMKIHDMPVFASSLEELPLVLKHLDRKYGLYDIKDAKKENGEYALRFILKHLSLHRESTCLEIAKAEHERIPGNQKKQRSLKSITNNVRKFIKNNLISSQLVYKGEPKIIANKHIETFSLSPIGILYVIHLFGKMIKNKNHSYDFEKIDVEFIKILGKEYSQTLPKIFGKFELFQKVLRKDFNNVLIGSLIPIFGPGISDFYDSRELLSNYVLRYFWATNPMKIMTYYGLIA